MSRRRSSTPRSNPTFSFPFQLPVLHPPRLAKRNSNASNVADPAKSPSGIKAQPEVMPPVRHHRRRSTLELPDVEKDGVLQIRSRRKHMVAPLTLSPRSFDAQLPSNSFCCDASGKSLISGKARGRRNQTKQLLSMDGECHLRQSWLTRPDRRIFNFQNYICFQSTSPDSLLLSPQP
jgi:hypothetical protein